MTDEGIQRIAPQLQYSVLCEQVATDDLGRRAFFGLFDIIQGKAPVRLLFVVSNKWTNGLGLWHQHTEILGPNEAEIVSSPETEIFLSARMRGHQVDDRFGVELTEPGRYRVCVYLENDLRLEYFFALEIVAGGT